MVHTKDIGIVVVKNENDFPVTAALPGGGSATIHPGQYAAGNHLRRSVRQRGLSLYEGSLDGIFVRDFTSGHEFTKRLVALQSKSEEEEPVEDSALAVLEIDGEEYTEEEVRDLIQETPASQLVKWDREDLLEVVDLFGLGDRVKGSKRNIVKALKDYL